MRGRIKEIAISLLVILALGTAIGYFYQSIQDGKRTEQIILYSLIPPGYMEALLQVNRPQTASSLIFSQKETQVIVGTSVPEIYFSMLRLCTAPALMSIHSQGVVFYTKADRKVVSRMCEQIFTPSFPAYAPQEERADDATLVFYPDTANRFFGYYHKEGILVASYNRGLLEDAARRQAKSLNHFCHPLSTYVGKFDPTAPANLLLPTSGLDLLIPLNDTLTWHSRKEWFTADIFPGEGRICCHGTMEAPFPIDSAYLPLAADTLSRQLEKKYPAVRIESQVYQEEGMIYFTGCTTNPS